MNYTFNLSAVDLFGIMLAVFILGMMAGWRWLPPPIDQDKEKLMDDLYKENFEFKIKALKGDRNEG